MKILMCSVPDVPIERSTQPLFLGGNNSNNSKQDSLLHARQIQELWLPVGILRINTWLEKNGYSSDIYDINNLRPSDEELIKNFKRTKPTVVGFGAPHTQCYPNVKRITKILRELFPDIWIVVGGHITGSANVILNKTETDICVIGDGEIPFVKLLDYFKLHPTRRQLDYKGFYQIKGLAFKDENNKLKVTGYGEQLPGSEMYFPALDKLTIGLQKYGGDGELIHEFFPPIGKLSKFSNFLLGDQIYPEELKFYEKNENKRFGKLHVSRGCVARCTFCQRAAKGYRLYPSNDLETHLIELKEKYNVGGLIIQDENFGSNRKHSYEIAQIIKKHDLFWIVINARSTSFTYEDLKFYKECNMVEVVFGIESGSQKILDIIEKKIKTKELYNTILNCKKVGIKTNPTNMLIGMPGETEETIIKSAQFSASLRYLLGMDWNAPHTSLALAIPGTPLYEYCQQIGAIGKTLDEEEDYLIRTSEHKNIDILNYVNKTNASIKEVYYWTYLYRYAAKKAFVDLIINNNKSIKNRLLQIYELCIKATLRGQIVNYNVRKKFNKNKKLLLKMKHLTLPMAHLLLSLIIPILPKNILFSIIRVYANIRFYFLNRNHELRGDKHKHNIFAQQTDMTDSNFRLTEDRIAKTNRQFDRSLRTVVMENRKKLKVATTEEEKGLQILTQGQ